MITEAVQVNRYLAHIVSITSYRTSDKIFAHLNEQAEIDIGYARQIKEFIR